MVMVKRMRLWRIPSNALSNRHLLDAHRTAHAIEAIIQKNTPQLYNHPEVNKWTVVSSVGKKTLVNEFFTYHKMLTNEMVSRNMNVKCVNFIGGILEFPITDVLADAMNLQQRYHQAQNTEDIKRARKIVRALVKELGKKNADDKFRVALVAAHENLYGV